jgi:conserved oligomeric Golgi complex subunit 1
METVSTFLDQRSKTLHTLLSRTPEPSLDITPDLQANGHPPNTMDSPVSRRPTVREVRQVSQTALDIISRTVTSVRTIFQQESDDHVSLVGRVLRHIQSDVPTTPSTRLPSELQLTTQSLLITLPSSAHFLLLPLNLRSYKPYVDLSSPSSSVSQTQITQKLDGWFRRSTQSLQRALELWFANLQSVKEVWTIRSSMRKWIRSASKMKQEEQGDVNTVIDDICLKRVTGIWNTNMLTTERAFREQLDSILADSMAIGWCSHPISTQKAHHLNFLLDASPIQNLFEPPSPPTISQTGIGHITTDISFQKYKSTLRQQLNGHTASLDLVLSILELCAKSLQKDISEVLTGNEDDTRSVVLHINLNVY